MWCLCRLTRHQEAVGHGQRSIHSALQCHSKCDFFGGEAQRGLDSCPGPHSKAETEQGSGGRNFLPLDLQSSFFKVFIHLVKSSSLCAYRMLGAKDSSGSDGRCRQGDTLLPHKDDGYTGDKPRKGIGVAQRRDSPWLSWIASKTS